MEFLAPWFANSDPGAVNELRREMAVGHVLEEIELSAIACRKDCDEVLYAFEDGSERFAIVHLTFRKSKEIDPRLPRTWIFRSRETLLEYFDAAHAAWTGREKDPEGHAWLKEQQLLNEAQRF